MAFYICFAKLILYSFPLTKMSIPFSDEPQGSVFHNNTKKLERNIQNLYSSVITPTKEQHSYLLKRVRNSVHTFVPKLLMENHNKKP